MCDRREGRPAPPLLPRPSLGQHTQRASVPEQAVTGHRGRCPWPVVPAGLTTIKVYLPVLPLSSKMSTGELRQERTQPTPGGTTRSTATHRAGGRLEGGRVGVYPELGTSFAFFFPYFNLCRRGLLPSTGPGSLCEASLLHKPSSSACVSPGPHSTGSPSPSLSLRL